MTLKLVIFFVTIISLPTLQFIFMFLIFWQTWKQSFPFIYSNFIPKLIKILWKLLNKKIKKKDQNQNL